MWYNQKSSYFLDTFGKQSRYLSKLISGNTGSTLSRTSGDIEFGGGSVLLKVRISFPVSWEVAMPH